MWHTAFFRGPGAAAFAVTVATTLLVTTASCDDDDVWRALEPPTVAAAPFDDLHTGCLKATFCGATRYGFQSCASQLAQDFERAPDAIREVMNQYFLCAATSSDCTEVEACRGTECDDTRYLDTCDGTTLQTCEFGSLVSVECGAPLTNGSTCQTNDMGLGFCTDRACSAFETDQRWCDHDIYYYCSDGYLWRLPCPLFTKSSCDPDLLVMCTRSTDEACDPETAVTHCEGDTRVGCDDSQGTRWQEDCGNNPLFSTCVQEAGDAFCVPPGKSAPNCDSGGFPTCEGSVLHFCDGWQRTFDCASMGLRCTVGSTDYTCVR